MSRLTFGRWTVELYHRALHLTHEPDPHCPDCAGEFGGWIRAGDHADWDECACLDQLRIWRLPLWPGSRATAEEPF